jgi:hypothetical protein
MATWKDENISPSVTGEVDAALVSLGQRGLLYVNINTTIFGNFAAIQMVTDTIFNSISLATTPNGATQGFCAAELDQACDCCTDTTPATFPAGFILYGPFVAFSLFSGSVIAYKA